MQNRKSKIATILVALFTLTTVAACNTIEGAGRDIEDAGDRIEDAAS